MKKLASWLTVVVVVFLLTGCATVTEVRRATDLIRTDNELTRLLVEVRPNDPIGAALYLAGVADHAKSEAEALQREKGKYPDAIAYYRIAATGYWRSGKSEVVNDLFGVTEAGTQLCKELGDKAPDRDCLFLELVIPFAALESEANEANAAGVLEAVNFTDTEQTANEIQTMKQVRESLGRMKTQAVKILSAGRENRFLSHPGMCHYYCENARKAVDHLDLRASLFETRVRDFEDNATNLPGSLGITMVEANGLRSLGMELPAFCGECQP